jgi:hypothetical protein
MWFCWINDIYAYIMIELWSYECMMVYLTVNWVLNDELNYDYNILVYVR